ncbi:MAG: LPS export ABC transporter periplasmic protein LptC [candidate division Zixibacteria bacterium]|nr:LPS export ABC transporter periplasmic protein LptC [candidate division Zixibacteria bacterium]
MKMPVYILFLLLVGSLIGCSNHESTIRTELASDSTRPDSEMRGATIDLLEGERVKTRIVADRILKFDAKDSTMGYVVHADFFDSLGNITTKLDGDSAYIRESTNHLHVFGRVVVVSDDNSTLETDYIHWNPDIAKIQTDAFVKVTRRGDVVTGWGLETDQRLKRIKILRQVSGTIQNTDEAGLK